MDITDWRARIDAVDELLIDLLNRRLGYAAQIGKIKRQSGQPVRDERREQALLSRLRAYNSGPLSDQAIEDLFTRVIEEAIQLEERG
ncbi:MAG: chorismate mutase [Candidatus Latescibacterota bacterium]|nr:chorismate mutase [Candidatus Latescibacterota bacterium]